MFWVKNSKSGKSIKDRFEEKYRKDPSGCWEWIACKHSRGYGQFFTSDSYSKRKMDFSHRVSYHLYKGIRPTEDECILHKCDNTSCVNPDHLRIGTHKDNMRDMMSKGRFISGVQRLTRGDMDLAIKMRSEGIEVKAIAKHFGIDRGYASRFSRGMVKQFSKERRINNECI